MSTALNPRRWFRFRLRTVLLILALLAIPCAWLGSEWKLVHERRTLIERVEAAGGEVFSSTEWLALLTSGAQQPTPAKSPWHYVREIVIKPGNLPRRDLSWIRRWLGDRDISSIRIPENFPDGDEKRILELFPQVDVTKFFSASLAKPHS